ncbi:MAG: hypothetical protein BWZ07_00408 [Alphaproteobacteria bacterium ADurb.BinA280]|jgi:hypothetical protein|nr:hypothetical protein [Aquimonas sp.]OPZ13575.1 MAG: hypothetical protein BWZ07_00408 [Alphaproteobacteria bacterium ADurb.BinA280]
MQAILDRFEQIAELLNDGQLDAAESALRIHDRAVRAAFLSAIPPDAVLTQRLLLRQQILLQQLSEARHALQQQLGTLRRDHAATRSYLDDARA